MKKIYFVLIFAAMALVSIIIVKPSQAFLIFPTQVTNCQDLQNINNNLAGFYQLTNDIDCSDTKTWNNGFGFIPIGLNVSIGTSSPDFTGTLDGSGHSINNLYINASNVGIGTSSPVSIGTESPLGMISSATGATIRNLNVQNASIQGDTYGNASILAGQLTNSLVQNVQVQGSIIAGTYATSGGITAVLNNSQIILSSANVNLTGGIYETGGLAGIALASTIDQSSSSGVINSNANTGGLVGGDNSDSLSISNSYSTASINYNCTSNPFFFNAEGVAGLLGNGGFTIPTTITNSYAADPITVTGSNCGLYMLGGLLGISTPTPVITSSLWDSQVTGLTSSEGSPDSAGLTTAQMYQQLNYTNWDFTNIWVGDNLHYPVLKWQEEPQIDLWSTFSAASQENLFENINVPDNIVNWADIDSANVNGVNWTDLLVLSKPFVWNNAPVTVDTINWANLTSLSQTGINWTDVGILNNAGINWASVNPLVHSGINWADWLVSSTSGINWTDLSVLSNQGINWTGIGLLNGSVNWTDLGIISGQGINWENLNILSNENLNWDDPAVLNEASLTPLNLNTLRTIGVKAQPSAVSTTFAVTASAGSGGTISPSGTINVNSGTDQVFTLTPNANYLPSLTVDGNTVDLTNNSYTLSNVTAPHIVTASFTQFQSLVDNSSCVSIAAPANVDANQSFSATVTLLNNGTTAWDPATLYRLGSQGPQDNITWGTGRVFLNSPVTPGNTVAITVNATAPLTPGTYAFDWKMVHDLVQWFGSTCTSTITVNPPSPTSATFAVVASAGSGGTISPPGTINVNSGADQVFTLTPGAGYVPSLTVDGNTVALTNNSYTLTNVTAPHRVTANFTPIQSLVDNSSCVSISAPANVNANQSFSATVTLLNNGTTTWDPAALYRLGSQGPQDNSTWGTGRVLLNSPVTPGNTVAITFNATAPLTPGTYAFDWKMLQEAVQWFGSTCNGSITVNPPTLASSYAVIVSAGSGGTISPSGTINVNSGADQVFTLTPSDGYVPSLTVDGNTVDLTNNSYTLSNVTAPHRVTANFTPIQSLVDNSSCVSITAPANVDANQSFSATVTLINNGTTAWDPAALYRLGSQGPQDNITWGTGRVLLNSPVTPGNTVAITFNATAPLTPGTYAFDWKMVHDLVQWFGTTCTSTITVNPPTIASSYAIIASAGNGGTISPSGTTNVNSGADQVFTLTPSDGYVPSLTVDGNTVALTNNSYTLSNVTAPHRVTASFLPIQSLIDNSSCVSITAPASVNANQSFSATVTLLNNGTTAWDPAALYRLGSQGPQDNITWGTGRVLLNSPVTPGNTVAITFNATAPSTPGTYAFDWKIVHDLVQWFGSTCTSSITVN